MIYFQGKKPKVSDIVAKEKKWPLIICNYKRATCALSGLSAECQHSVNT